MRPKDQARAAALTAALNAFAAQSTPLPGIADSGRRGVLVEQILESLHRVEYVARIRQRDIGPNRGDPSHEAFDPLKAAIHCQNSGEIDEAFWLVFIFVHFGKSARTGWRLAREVYGALGGQHWTWRRVSADPRSFRNWLAGHSAILEGGDGIERQFGNHRRYLSISANSHAGTGAAVVTYVEWVGPSKTHITRVQEAVTQGHGDPRKAFHFLYRSMRGVKSFGRLARFDYVAMLGKLGLAPVEPASAYMSDATGPRTGARLLFEDGGQALTPTELDARLIQLGAAVGINMQVVEDALCNWQKSPDRFIPFRG